MRLLEIYLIEHNVVNTDEIKAFAERFAEMCEAQNAAEWFRLVLPRYLERDDSVNVKLTDDNIPKNSPEWLEDAIARGDDLRVFYPPQHMVPALEHLVDYFNWLSRENDPVMVSRDRLVKVTVEQALKKAHDWTEREAKRAQNTEVKDMKLVKQVGTFAWLEPQTIKALKRDGAILHQCTANGVYDLEFKNKSMRFLLLHDKGGTPHVCISFHMSGDEIKSLDQVKGKQNLPPVGRYATLCADLFNELDIPNLNHNGDVQRMGLVRNEEGKLVAASQAATSKLVFRIGNVRVYESERGGTRVGLKDYWFNSHEGDLFKITINQNKEALLTDWAAQIDEGKVAEYAKKFLNEFFEVAPRPINTTSRGVGDNKLKGIGLGNDRVFYDYIQKKYAHNKECTLVIDMGEYKGYLRGDMNYSTIHHEVYVYKNDRLFANIKLAQDGKKFGYILFYDDNSMENNRYLVAQWLTVLKTSANGDISLDKSRKDAKLYYSLKTDKWGKAVDVFEHLWSKNGYTLVEREEVAGKVYYQMLDKDENTIFEISDSRGFNDVGDAAKAKKLLLVVLNTVEKLDFVKDQNQNRLDRFGLIVEDGVWKDRKQAGKLYHEFDDGFTFKVVDSGAKEKTFDLIDARNKRILSISTSPSITAAERPDSASIVGARHLHWLLDHLGTPPIDTIDGGGRWEQDSPKHILWTLGLFHDTRTDSWKLIQDGKLIYRGSEFRAVNFRNRVFLIDDADGVVGWIKKKDRRITDHDVMSGEERPFYLHLKELISNTDLFLPRPSDEYERQNFRKHGFVFDDAGFSDIEDKYPTKTVVKIAKGYEWVRKAVDKTFHDIEKKDQLHGDRYSLQGADGESFMRAIVDGEYLDRVFFSLNGGFDTKHLSTVKNNMSAPQKKALFELLEKLEVKLTPRQSREIGYYRTKKGIYKPLKGNAALEGFLEGKITFPDGMEFRYNEYESEWQLGNDDANEEHEYARWKPILKVKLDDDGIESVGYSKKEVKRNPKAYMPYIHKLIQIFSTVSGE